MAQLKCLVGILLLLGIAYWVSNNRKRIRWRTVFWGFSLQFIFALVILKTNFGKKVFVVLNDIIIGLLDCTREGSAFVFGKLVNHSVPVVPVAAEPGIAHVPEMVANTGAFFAFSVLPTIIFFSALMAILYHLGALQKLVQGMAWVMSKTMGTSGAESLSASGNIFLGQTEAPLLVRPYVARMTQSELMAIMTGGFATVAGGVMAAYVAMLRDTVPNIAGHLMAASIMAAPVGLVFAKMFVPETEEPETGGSVKTNFNLGTRNVIDAAATGASQGVNLAINVGAMLIAFLALLAVVNSLLSWSGGFVGYPDVTLSQILGFFLAPVAFLYGIPWSDCSAMGNLLATKLMVNEFVAYAQLQEFTAAGAISERTAILSTYFLCGFANVGSIGIQLGGIGGMAPERKSDLAAIGPKAMIAGAMASCSTAFLAGILL